MGKFWGALVLALLLAGSSDAFLEETQMFICEEAAIRVWGASVVAECFSEMKPSVWNGFCSDDMPSAELAAECMNYSKVGHPSVLADNLFNDSLKHVDYAECSIKMRSDREYLCGNESIRPGIEYALLWFNKSDKAKNLCEAMYAFCVGSNYLADSFLPTNRFVGGIGSECERRLQEHVEQKIVEKDAEWGVNIQCRIPYIKPMVGNNMTVTANQNFLITNDGIEKIIGELVSYGENISAKPMPATSTTSSTTTSSTTLTSTVPATTSTTTLTVVVETRREGGYSKALLSLALIILVALAAVLIKSRRDGKEKKEVHALLSSDKHKPPTHLEKV